MKPLEEAAGQCELVRVLKRVETGIALQTELRMVPDKQLQRPVIPNRWRVARALALGIVGFSTSAQQGTDVVMLPDQIAWGPASPKLPAGAQIAVVYGDMSKPGELYAFRAKLPDGYSVAPHTHPMDEHVTVIKGTMMLGFGQRRDEESMRELPAGSYVRLPTDVPHYNRMEGETILQFHGIGPYDIIYVNPEDDPSR